MMGQQAPVQPVPQAQPTYEQVLMQGAQSFMTRSDLKGAEVDTYAKTFNLLQTVVEGENLIVPVAAWQEGLAAIEKIKELDAAGEVPEGELDAVDSGTDKPE